jgi:glucose-6-phosphate isomerase
MLHFNYSKILNTQYPAEWKNIFKDIINRKEIGFFHLVEHQEHLENAKLVYEKFKDKKYFIHVGIGGSALGPEMLLNAVGKKTDTKFIFINNIDSEKLSEQLEGIDLHQACIYIVSKSGTTAETMAAFSILLQKGQFKEETLKNNFVFCTDPEKGDLRSLSKKLGISCLTIPENIGGRFSVLTGVGLLPALFAKIKIDELYQGAVEFQNHLLDGNELYQLASFILEHKKEGKDQTVFMPYSSKLKSLSDWFIQLWAESLGKKHSLKNEIIHTGLTPIAAYGATDQHSQVQLFMEGPLNKVFILIHIKERKTNFNLNSPLSSPSLDKLKNISLNQLMTAELEGTKKAFIEANRPFVCIDIDHCDEKHLAALILTFESLTALVGNLLNIDPFDQPGVEAGKKYAWEWLSNS